VPRTAGLAEALVLVIDVAHLADGGHAAHVHATDLPGGQPDECLRAFLGHELRGGAGRADDLPATAGDELDVVELRAQRDVAEWQGVAHPCLGALAGDDRVPHLQAVGHEDVALLAVGVVQQADAGRAVGVVLDGRQPGRHIELVASEVDTAVVPLGAATAVAHREATLVVAPEPRFLGSSSGLCGVSVVISSKVDRVMKRRPGEVGL